MKPLFKNLNISSTVSVNFNVLISHRLFLFFWVLSHKIVLERKLIEIQCGWVINELIILKVNTCLHLEYII